jgi:hypothetical protein
MKFDTEAVYWNLSTYYNIGWCFEAERWSRYDWLSVSPYILASWPYFTFAAQLYLDRASGALFKYGDEPVGSGAREFLVT